MHPDRGHGITALLPCEMVGSPASLPRGLSMESRRAQLHAWLCGAYKPARAPAD